MGITWSVEKGFSLDLDKKLGLRMGLGVGEFVGYVYGQDKNAGEGRAGVGVV